MKRRSLLACGVALTPLAAAFVGGCSADDEGRWAEGMLPIKWDRDTCARCGMAISDRRFAAQLRGGPKNAAVKFDDIGCAATWCAEKLNDSAWLADAATRLWVAEFGGNGERWLDARRAHYVKGGSRSPMGYDYAAHAQPQPGSLGFDAMSRLVSATWPANCVPGEDMR
jgi:nitrous oxide reductase accessory protein NosL